MRILEGKAKGLQRSINATTDGGGSAHIGSVRAGTSVNASSSITITHVTEFRLAGESVVFKSSKATNIEDGDELSVAGHDSVWGRITKKPTFRARAYFDKKARVIEHEGWIGSVLIGAVFLLVALYAEWQFSDPFFGVMSELFAGAFALAGVYNIVDGLVVKSAIGLLQKRVW